MTTLNDSPPLTSQDAETTTHPEVQSLSEGLDRQHGSLIAPPQEGISLGQVGVSLEDDWGEETNTPHSPTVMNNDTSPMEDPSKARPVGASTTNTQTRIPSPEPESTPSIMLDNGGDAALLASLNDKSTPRRKHSNSYASGFRHFPTSSLILGDTALTSTSSIHRSSVRDLSTSHRRIQSGSDPSPHHSASSLRLNHRDDEHIPLNSFDQEDPEYQKDDLIDIDTPSKFTITTGWSFKLASLLCHGVILTCWGITLIILASGIVPSDWSFTNGTEINNDGNPPSNIVLGLVAAISTMYITFVVQSIIRKYTHCLLVDGFTLGELRYLQGIQEVSIFTRFPSREKGWRFFRFITPKLLLWIAIYAGIILQTASLIAIFQPKLSISTHMFNDGVPCGIELSNLTLDSPPFLGNPVMQHLLDTTSYSIGIQLANYGDQTNGNVTLSISGGLYVKDVYAYGMVSRVFRDGLQELPGLAFTAQCSDQAGDYAGIWKAVFPDRSLPTVNTLKNGSMSFVDTPIPSSMRSVVTDDGPFNVTKTHSAMYALVDPSGSGALITIAFVTTTGAVDLGSTLVCSWTTAPKIIQAQIVGFTAGVIQAKSTNLYPTLAGRATLMTLQGMADASRLGASLIETTYNPLSSGKYAYALQPSEILEAILADGGKAGNSYFNQLGSPTMCSSNSRSVIQHWKFGNEGNLGWIAAVWATAVGVLAIVVALLFSRRKRMENVDVLRAAKAFELGRGSDLGDNEVLCVRDGRVVCRCFVENTRV